jgi:cytochrome c oxidase subunit 2
MREVPKGAMNVKVIGQMYFWTFEYEGGKKSDVLRVPVKKPIRLQISSKDVVHSFYVPAFRIKEDAVPGMETHSWFFADKPDNFDIYCAEYCGISHSKMITQLIVMSEDEFQKWLASSEKSEISQDSESRKILKVKGCLSCHSTDGSKVVGPSFKGFMGSRTVKTKGKERVVTGDREYLKSSLLEPEKDLVKGYPPIMPPFKGNITEKEIDILFEYFKTLK